ncbi:hypothetical protein E2C01_078799 [Portunus trituberculatus]|uniref:Uncharacterized protein n=1 Tax=Portunus trituberculatus TaxID=210409 RepID=A0A5B7INT5_PORTR|nr:hypothetical protein [Portunus trituberculatus]
MWRLRRGKVWEGCDEECKSEGLSGSMDSTDRAMTPSLNACLNQKCIKDTPQYNTYLLLMKEEAAQWNASPDSYLS